MTVRVRLGAEPGKLGPSAELEPSTIETGPGSVAAAAARAKLVSLSPGSRLAGGRARTGSTAHSQHRLTPRHTENSQQFERRAANTESL